MITSLRITDGSIGNNVTVQVGPLVSNGSQHNNNFSDPITLGMNAIIMCDRMHACMYVLCISLHV